MYHSFYCEHAMVVKYNIREYKVEVTSLSIHVQLVWNIDTIR